MDANRIGADVRLLRRRKGWTQARVGGEAKLSRWFVSEVECGRGDRVSGVVLERVVNAVGGYLSVRVLYHGEALDRLRDRAHAALVEALVSMLVALGWAVETEVSFNHFGDRGVIDVLAFHPRVGMLLVIEVKTVVPDLGGMLAALDRKARVAPKLAEARGWEVRAVSRLLVFPETSTGRRRVATHATTFLAAFPERNEAIRRWLRDPMGPIRGLLFLADAAGGSARRRRSP